MKFDLYKQLTDELVERMEGLGTDWIPAYPRGGVHRNVISDKPYRGINMLRLWIHGQKFGQTIWGTFKQWSQLGYSVTKGSKGTMIVYYGEVKKEEPNGEEHVRMFLRYSKIFNADQVRDADGNEYPAPNIPVYEHGQDEHDLAMFDEIIGKAQDDQHPLTYEEIPAGPPHYVPGTDIVRFVKLSSYKRVVDYVHDGCHELAHWTGAKHRLNREMDYAEEELVAELAAHFLAHQAGISKSTQDSTAMYLNHWIEQAKRDKSYLMRHISAAAKAADYLLPEEVAAEELAA